MIFNRIVVPMDGTQPSGSVIPHVRRLAGPAARIWLQRVLPRRPTSPDEVQAAHDYLAGVALELGHPGAHAVVSVGDPADQILWQITEVGADLVALTLHASSVLRRLVMGSVARRVARACQRPLLLVHPHAAEPAPELRRILVPLDGRETSEEILELVRPLAARTGAQVVLLRVLAPVPVIAAAGEMSPTFVSAPPAPPDRRFTERARELVASGLRARLITIDGEPVVEILRQAAELRADLIAMSTGGRSRLERLLVGSVAQSVVERSPCGVLLSKASA